MKNYATGGRHGLWKGEKVGYHALHAFLSRRYGKPKECAACGVAGVSKNGRWTIEWANTTGVYNRQLKNWKKLCVSCHRKEDNVPRKRNAYGQFL
jgi:hypothetical protein